jgi:hypothetical protein
VEVDSAVAQLPFGGWMTIESDGAVTGVLVDSLGAAGVTGQMTDDVLMFQKTYTTGRCVGQPDTHYQLSYYYNSHTIAYAGAYKCSADQPTDDGNVKLNFLPGLLLT